MTHALPLALRSRMFELARARVHELRREQRKIEHEIDHGIFDDCTLARLDARLVAIAAELRSANAVLNERRKELER